MGSYIFGFLGVSLFFIFTVTLANVPECLYCRRKVKWSSFNLKNGSIHKNRKRLLQKVTTTVSEHFFPHSNHSHTDMHLIPLEKIHSSRDSVRKARESHLIDKAMTGASVPGYDP